MDNKPAPRILDAVRGSLIGGAAGDALGYAVEFVREDYIFNRYGKKGITEYELDEKTGKALISDDTQMTLFTAVGLLHGQTRARLRGIAGPPASYVAMAYNDWLTTQTSSFEEVREARESGSFDHAVSWLLDEPGLFERRAPGNTCLSALMAARQAGSTISPLKETTARAAAALCERLPVRCLRPISAGISTLWICRARRWRP